MFGINQIVQTVGQTEPVPQLPPDAVLKKDAEADASKRFWVGIAGGVLAGFAGGFAAAKQGWL